MTQPETAKFSDLSEQTAYTKSITPYFSDLMRGLTLLCHITRLHPFTIAIAGAHGLKVDQNMITAEQSPKHLCDKTDRAAHRVAAFLREPDVLSLFRTDPFGNPSPFQRTDLHMLNIGFRDYLFCSEISPAAMARRLKSQNFDPQSPEAAWILASYHDPAVQPPVPVSDRMRDFLKNLFAERGFFVDKMLGNQSVDTTRAGELVTYLVDAYVSFRDSLEDSAQTDPPATPATQTTQMTETQRSCYRSVRHFQHDILYHIEQLQTANVLVEHRDEIIAHLQAIADRAQEAIAEIKALDPADKATEDISQNVLARFFTRTIQSVRNLGIDFKDVTRKEVLKYALWSAVFGAGHWMSIDIDRKNSAIVALTEEMQAIRMECARALPGLLHDLPPDELSGQAPHTVSSDTVSGGPASVEPETDTTRPEPLHPETPLSAPSAAETAPKDVKPDTGGKDTAPNADGASKAEKVDA